MMIDFDKFFKTFVLAWFAWLLVGLAAWLAIIIVIIHFVRKLWR